jgi:glycosyltransferase involved in cell wall biosynthesis
MGPVLVLHNRYRTTGGEERAVDDLLWLAREQLGMEADLLDRDSALLGRSRAAVALLRGGLDPGDVAAAVRRTGARIVHAHNVQPAFGWRALAAAREAGARVVLHLHNYRLVCAVATCFTRGEDCTRCHGRNTLPGVRLACRGNRVEAAVYGAALALWQRRLASCVDAFVMPSRAGVARLRVLGAPIGDDVAIVSPVQRRFAERSRAGEGGYALVAGRLAVEKGIEDAIAACARAGIELVVAGDGPAAPRLRAMAGSGVRFTGLVDQPRLADLRAGAGVAVLGSRCAEVMPLAAVEAMSEGVPVVGTRMGGLPEIVGDDDLAAAGDVEALAGRIAARFRDAEAGARALATARERFAPERVAGELAAVYERVTGERPVGAGRPRSVP